MAHPAHKSITGLRAMLGECGMLAYVSYMAERLVEIHRILKPTGSIYLHCDPTAGHYLKVMMDGIFGHGNIRNEIIWAYTGPGSPKMRQFNRKHDTLFWYNKGKTWTFNSDDVRLLHKDGAPHSGGFKGGGRSIEDPYYKTKGKIPETWWTDIAIAPRSKTEYLGYSTQKPLKLLDRIIRASSNEGDVVLDPFCGCGTTIEAAHKLRRHFVGIDISHYAIDLVRARRLKDASVPVNGIPVDMFTARTLARDKPFEFEKWAITRVPGMVPNQRQVGDRGIDGRGKILYGGLVLAQVKGGRFALSQLRDFHHVVDREKASCGLFTTLDAVSTRETRLLVQNAGYFEIEQSVSQFPKMQLWSIEEYFQNRLPELPPMADPYTGKRVQIDLLTGG